MKRTADVVIIGAGIIGVAIAYELSQRGYATVSVDRLPAAGYGPTSNSCSIVRLHYSSATAVALAQDSVSYWEHWPDYLGCFDEAGYARYVQTGTLLLKSPAGHTDKVVPHFRALNVEYEDMDLAAMAARWPMFDLHSYWPPTRPDDDRFWTRTERWLEGGIFTPQSGYVSDPQLATHNLQRAAQAKGARFVFNSEVTAITRRNGRIAGVELSGVDHIEAPVVVNVAGPQSARINRLAGAHEGMNISTRALRHEVHHVPSPHGVDFERDGCHVSDGDSAIYFRPDSGNNILVGSEDPGCDDKTWVTDPDHYHRGITQLQWEAQVYRLARRMPGLRIPNARKGVVDLYDVSDDWVPIYDRSDVDGFYMAVGTSGNQFKNAAPVGCLMASLIDHCESGHDHDDDPVKLISRHTSTAIDTSFYSRRRQLNRDSSFSVVG